MSTIKTKIVSAPVNGPTVEPLVLQTNNTDRVTVNSSGNVGIGTSSPLRPLQVTSNSAETQILLRESDSTGPQLLIGADSAVSGSIINASSVSGSNSNLLLQTAGVERARIDASGNFMVGTIAPIGQFTSTVTSGPGASVSGINTSTAYNGDGIVTVRAARTTTNSSFFAIGYWNTGVSNYRFYVNDAGAVFSTSTSITAISDATLKENIRDLDTGLPQVMALKPRRFDWKNGDAQNVAGFVAQEVEEVLPELVADYGYSKDEDDNIITKKSLKMGDMLPTLVKAIQEQQAMIEELKAKVAALETNE